MCCLDNYDLFECVDFSVLPTHGPCSKFNFTDSATGESFKGKVTIEFDGEPYKVGEVC